MNHEIHKWASAIKGNAAKPRTRSGQSETSHGKTCKQVCQTNYKNLNKQASRHTLQALIVFFEGV